MRRHWQLWKMALRAALWRATADPPAIGPAGLAGWTVATVVLLFALQIPTPDAVFSEYGLGLLVGAVMVSLGAAALALPAEHRVSALAAMLLIGVAALLVTIAGLAIIGPQERSASRGLWTRTDSMIALFLFQSVWLIGAYAAVVRSVDPERRHARWRRATAAWALQIAVLLAFPHYPAFVSPDTSARPPNSWAYVRGLINSGANDDAETRRVDGARVELAQPALMDEAIARLAPQVPGETDIYAIGVAGWAEQDVFVKELEGALAAIGKVAAGARPHAAPRQSRRLGRTHSRRGARELRRIGARDRTHHGHRRGRAVVVHDLARLDRRDRVAPAGTGQQRTCPGGRGRPCSTARASATASWWCRPVIPACS